MSSAYSGAMLVTSESKSLLQHCIAFRAELAPGFPTGKFIAICDLITDFQKKLNILHCAGEVPVWINFVGRLVIMFRDKFVALLFSVPWRFADNLDAAGCMQHGHAGFCEFETVHSIETAFLRFAVRSHHAPLSRGSLA